MRCFEQLVKAQFSLITAVHSRTRQKLSIRTKHPHENPHCMQHQLSHLTLLSFTLVLPNPRPVSVKAGARWGWDLGLAVVCRIFPTVFQCHPHFYQQGWKLHSNGFKTVGVSTQWYILKNSIGFSTIWTKINKQKSGKKKKEFLTNLLFGHPQLLSLCSKTWRVCKCLLFYSLL